MMPLMSAAKLWLDLKSTVADDKMFDDITVLLLVQVREETKSFQVSDISIVFHPTSPVVPSAAGRGCVSGERRQRLGPLGPEVAQEGTAIPRGQRHKHGFLSHHLLHYRFFLRT